jgi:integrase
MVLPLPVAWPGGLPGGAAEADAFVFTAPQGGPLRVIAFRARVWRPATRKAGLDGLRIHDLRHTAVALWIAAGAGPKEVATRAGHTSVSFTLDRYGHLYPEADTALRDRLDALYVAGAGAEPGDRAAPGPLAAPARPRNGMSAADGAVATF